MHSIPAQNLNDKLSRMQRGRRRLGHRGLGFPPSPIQSSAPPTRIVGSPVRYRGGYHLSV